MKKSLLFIGMIALLPIIILSSENSEDSDNRFSNGIDTESFSYYLRDNASNLTVTIWNQTKKAINNLYEELQGPREIAQSLFWIISGPESKEFLEAFESIAIKVDEK